MRCPGFERQTRQASHQSLAKLGKLHRQVLGIRSLTRFAGSPFSTGFRYFIVHTRCKCISCTVCAPQSYSPIPPAYWAALLAEAVASRRGLDPSQMETVVFGFFAREEPIGGTPSRLAAKTSTLPISTVECSQVSVAHFPLLRCRRRFTVGS